MRALIAAGEVATAFNYYPYLVQITECMMVDGVNHDLEYIGTRILKIVYGSTRPSSKHRLRAKV